MKAELLTTNRTQNQWAPAPRRAERFLSRAFGITLYKARGRHYNLKRMAYVIGEACIDVKDTACVDVCPVDCIHSKEGANQYYIDPATCIDCNACEPVCPVKAIFPGDQVPQEQKKFIGINADFFKGFDKSKSTAYTRKKKAEAAAEEPPAAKAPGEGAQAPGEAAEAAAAPKAAEWKEVPGWEAAWEASRRSAPDPLEVRKRYGIVRTVIEEEGHYTIRFFLPERTPDHIFRYRYGLPEEMCAYDVTAEVEGNLVRVRGRVSDPSIAKLCGHVNSFPDRFACEYPFPGGVVSASVKPRGSHVVDVVVQKAAPKARAA